MSSTNKKVRIEKTDNWGGVIGKDKAHAKKRIGWIDLIRVTSAFLVIVSHASYQYWAALPGTIPDSYWLFTNFTDTFSRCAVPLFLMVSGYLILKKPNSLKHGYFKRLLKIGIPLVVWSVIHLVIQYHYRGVDGMGNPVNVYNGIRCILTGNVSEHLWFLYAIISLYIAAPILHSYLKSASRENKIYFLLLWGCACFLWPIISNVLAMLFEIKKVNFNFYIVGENLGFFVAGYFLGHRTINPKICFLCLISFFIIAVTITWVGFYVSETENMRTALALYLRIPLVLMLFVVLKYIGDTNFYKHSVFSVGTSRLALLTFGIYLVHIPVTYAFGKNLFGFSLNIHTFDPWFSQPLTAGIVYAISALTVWMLQKLPLARWILP